MAATRHSITVGVHDARKRFFQLLAKAASGEEIIITKYGVPIARLVPFKKRHTVAERRQAIERFRQLSKDLSLGNLKIRDLINEGRP
jgi:prevent-host-death family protein